jgi:hypothetical protein
MPAAVLVVHDEQNTRELAVGALREAFLEAVGSRIRRDRSRFSRPCPGYACDVWSVSVIISSRPGESLEHQAVCRIRVSW